MIEKLKQEIRLEAEKIVTNPGLPTLSFQAYQDFFKTGNRLKFESDYFERRRQLVTLGLAYLEDNKQGLKEALENVIWEICNEYSWSLPAHFEEENGQFVLESDVNIDLFAAETGQALAEMCELFGTRLAPEVSKRVLVEVKRRLFYPLLERQWRWEQMANNWSAVVAGSIGLAALSLLPKSEEQHQIIARLDEVFKVYLSSFEKDGACLEGVGYWAYGFGYYMYFAEKYAQVYGSNRYLVDPKLREIAAFPYRALISERQFVPFSDANKIELPTGLLSYCHQKFSVLVPNFSEANPLEFDHCYRWAHLYRNIIWTEALEKVPPESTTIYFSNANWVIYRSKSDEFIFAAKAGSNDESHNHNDVGHFIIGNPGLWLTDLGAGEYTKDYFIDETRYQFLPNRSLGHSVPVINGYEQRYGNYCAKEVVCNDTQNELQFSFDLTDVYPKGALLEHYCRTFKLDKVGQSVTVVDDMTFKSDTNIIKQNFVSLIEPRISQEGVYWQRNQEELCLKSVNGQITYYKEYYQNHQGQTKEAYLLQIGQESLQNYRQSLTFKKISNEKVAVKR